LKVKKYLVNLRTLGHGVHNSQVSYIRHLRTGPVSSFTRLTYLDNYCCASRDQSC